MLGGCVELHPPSVVLMLLVAVSLPSFSVVFTTVVGLILGAPCTFKF